MIREIFYKIFRTEPFPCASCETLREQLSYERTEKTKLLERILELTAPKNEPVEISSEIPEPIKQGFVPWRIRQQMLEAEDRQKAKLMREKKDEITKLEKDTGIA